MKYILLSLCLALAVSLLGQSPPQGISYQAVARDAEGLILADSAITVKMTIVANGADGTDMWIEFHDVVTNQFGLFSLIIGSEDNIGGASPSFDLINWGAFTYFLRVEVDPGDGLFELMGVSQLMSVPYALYAGQAGNSNDDDPDPTNELITSISVENDSLIIEEAGTQFIIDIGEIAGDNFGDECMSLVQLSGTNLNIVECGESYVIPLDTLIDDMDWQQTTDYIYNDTHMIGIGTDEPQSHLEITGSLAFEVSQVQGPINVLLNENNHVVIADISNADVTINLPAAATCHGRQYIFKVFSSGPVNDFNLQTFASETIDGVDDITLTGVTNQAFTVISDGENWWVISGSIAP